MTAEDPWVGMWNMRCAGGADLKHSAASVEVLCRTSCDMELYQAAVVVH